MKIERIVSFLPSATELIYEFEKDDLLFGTTHECKYPPEAQKKLQVINSVFEYENLTSVEINNKTCQLLTSGKEIFKINDRNLIKANPDLIITQKTCEVCAAYTNQVKKALEILPKKPIIYSIDPHNLEEILLTITDLGNILQEYTIASKIRSKLEERISKIKRFNHEANPKVLALEWIDPFFTAGHWVPEMIEYAGGINMISKKGERSRKTNLDEISKSDPDIVVLMPCGFSAERTMKEYHEVLKNNQKWNRLKAVKMKNVFVVDANSFFSKPSIRTITGLEILSKIIHPNDFSEIKTPNGSYFSLVEFIEN